MCTGERAAEIDRADGHGDRDGGGGGEDEEEGPADFPSLHWVVAGGLVVAVADGRGGGSRGRLRDALDATGAFLKSTPLLHSFSFV